jgi:hypothetical protein
VKANDFQRGVLAAAAVAADYNSSTILPREESEDARIELEYESPSACRAE